MAAVGGLKMSVWIPLEALYEPTLSARQKELNRGRCGQYTNVNIALPAHLADLKLVDPAARP